MKSCQGLQSGLFKRFKPSKTATLLMLTSCALLMGLGFWQLHRAQEKQDLLFLAAQQAQRLPSVWKSGMPLPRVFQRVEVQGHYLGYTFLLDNQHSDHQWGYHVLNALLVSETPKPARVRQQKITVEKPLIRRRAAPSPHVWGEGKMTRSIEEQVVLVDRGWVLGDLRRMVLPRIVVPSGRIQVQGQAYYPSSKGLVLGEIFEPHGASFGVIERVDTKLISNILHKKVYPFIIRLDRSAKAGYVRDWPVVAMSPQRHYAYALQWFAMALLVCVIYGVLSIKK
jgi:surfeit locus 1 family protein